MGRKKKIKHSFSTIISFNFFLLFLFYFVFFLLYIVMNRIFVFFLCKCSLANFCLINKLKTVYVYEINSPVKKCILFSFFFKQFGCWCLVICVHSVLNFNLKRFHFIIFFFKQRIFVLLCQQNRDANKQEKSVYYVLNLYVSLLLLFVSVIKQYYRYVMC